MLSKECRTHRASKDEAQSVIHDLREELKQVMYMCVCQHLVIYLFNDLFINLFNDLFIYLFNDLFNYLIIYLFVFYYLFI